MTKWLPPNGFTGMIHHMVATAGAIFKTSFTNFSSGHSSTFGKEYLGLIPFKLNRYTGKFDDPNLPGEIPATIFLKQVSRGTESNIVQEGLPEVIPIETR